MLLLFRYRLAMLTILGLFALALWVPGAKANPVALEYTRAQLKADHQQVTPGQRFWLLLQLDIREHWHTYWRNPGDSGMALRLRWQLPKGVRVGDIHWWPPKRIPVGPLMNYGYEQQAWHLLPIELSDQISADALLLKVRASWLVCKEECIPEAAELQLNLKLGEEPLPSADFAKITELRQTLKAIPTLSAKLGTGANGLRLSIDKQALTLEALQSAYFYANSAGVIDPAAPQLLEFTPDQLHLMLAPGVIAAPSPITGLLTLETSAGDIRHYAINQPLLAGPVGVSSRSSAVSEALLDPQRAGLGQRVYWLALALLGGIILNAMPCVFPILSLKALALVKGQQQNLTERRIEGLAYAAGILLSFLVLALVVLALRGAGVAVGWGFQMQSPLFVSLLVYLVFLVGLNLSALLPLHLSVSTGQALTERSGWLGSFMTGVLASAVATPCTAPFMATAVGIALLRPALELIGIFLALGLGLALPYLLISWLPILQRLLPKPGAWMETFRQALAFPMYLTMVWLLWVLAELVSSEQLARVLCGLVALAFALWCARRLKRRRWRLAGVLIGLLGAAWIPWQTPGEEVDKEFSQSRLAQLRSEATPVLVNVTAHWCITCKVNERLVFARADVQAHLADLGVELLVADWTDQDAEISAYLSSFGRAGVPLYVYYPALGEPQILPQLLTPGLLMQWID